MTEPMLQKRFITASDGTRLNVIETGSAIKGHPVIAFVPGWSMPASIWRAQLLALGSHHRVAALDPRGQGESDIPRAGYTLRQRADDIGRFVNRYPRVLLVAWSLGALESLEFLHRQGSARVAGLVIVDSSVGEGPAPMPALQGATFRDELRADRNRAMTDFVRAIFRTPPPQVDFDALRDAALRMPLEASLALFPSRVPREHWRMIVHRFRRPLLYLITPQFAAQAALLQAARPGTQVEVFEQAGHALFVDEPQRFNAALEAFLHVVEGARSVH